MSTATLVKTIRARISFKGDPLLWLGLALLVTGVAGISKYAHGLGTVHPPGEIQHQSSGMDHNFN